MINSMIAHEAKDGPSLHDELCASLRRNSEMEAEIQVLKKVNRILMDRIEALNLDLGLKENRTWQD